MWAKAVDARMKLESERTLKRKCEVPDAVREPAGGGGGLNSKAGVVWVPVLNISFNVFTQG